MKEEEKLKLKEEHEFWKAKLEEFQTQEPELKSAVYVLEGQEIRGQKNPEKLAEAKASLADLQSKIETAKDKMAGIDSLLNETVAKETEADMAAIGSKWQALNEEKERHEAEICDLAGRMSYLLDCYVKIPDRHLDVRFVDNGIHLDQRQIRLRDTARSAFTAAKEKAAAEHPEALTFWNRMQAIRSLETLKKGTHKAFQQAVQRRVNRFLEE